MQDMVKLIIENDTIIILIDHSARAMEDPKVHKTFNYDDITNFLMRFITIMTGLILKDYLELIL